MVSASVRGIGVAVIDSKCGTILSLCTSAFLCLTPNLCCSSIMAYARCLNFTDFCIKECVPTSTGISPFPTHFRSCAREMSVAPCGFTFDGNFRQPEEVISPMLIGKCEKKEIKFSNCCLASISVGHK